MPNKYEFLPSSRTCTHQKTRWELKDVLPLGNKDREQYLEWQKKQRRKKANLVFHLILTGYCKVSFVIPNLDIRTLRFIEGKGSERERGLPEITQKFNSRALILTHTAVGCKPRTLVYNEFKAGIELITLT